MVIQYAADLAADLTRAFRRATLECGHGQPSGEVVNEPSIHPTPPSPLVYALRLHLVPANPLRQWNVCAEQRPASPRLARLRPDDPPRLQPTASVQILAACRAQLSSNLIWAADGTERPVWARRCRYQG